MSTPTFFIDRNLGNHRFPRRLADAGLRIELLDAHFPPDVADEVWIPAVAAYGWYVFSRDARIYKNPVQRHIVIASGLGLFIVAGGNRRTEELADNVVQTYPAILRFTERTSRPFIASVLRASMPERPGQVALRYPRSH